MTDVAFARHGDAFIDLVARTFPTSATLIGIHDHDAELGSFTEQTMTTFASSLRSLRARVEETDPSGISASERIDRAFVLHAVDSALLEAEGTQWWRRNPEFALDTALVGLFFLMVRDFAPAPDRARALEGRLRRLPSFLEESRRTLSETPRDLVEIAAQSADSGAELADGTIPAWAASLNGGGAGVRDAAPAAAEALRGHAAWLREEYAPRANAPVGVGEALLARIIATNHLLPDTPDGVARRGQEMLARLTASITEAAKDLGFADWRAAVAEVKKDVPGDGEVIDAYAEAMRWSEGLVREHGLATPVEGAPLEVRATPAFWRHTLPYAAYSMPAPFDAEQRGIFWVTPPEGDPDKLKGHSRASIAVVALHEGFPGHHLQLTRANRHPSRVRRLADSSLFIEGWAFYCEEMAHEQGLLSPEARLCQLKDEIWRACRIVIDMRLHQREMTPEEAVEMLVREADLERPNAEAEVRRYIYSPGYQMAYAIGKEEILGLRDRVKRAEGPGFSLRAFHDRVLDEGSLPVALIREAIEA